MARARKSHASDEEKTKKRSGPIEYPYVIYCDYKREDDEYPRVLVLKFTDAESARNMVDQVIGNDEWEWKLWFDRDDMIVTSKGIKIRAGGSQMREVMDVNPEDVDRAEIKWVLQFKYGSSESKRQDPQNDEDSDLPKHAPAARAARAEKREREVKEKKPKVDTSEMVSANDIAKKLNVEGREVRVILRGLKMEKPAHGWAWPKDEAKKIEEKVSAGLKEAKAKKKK